MPKKILFLFPPIEKSLKKEHNANQPIPLGIAYLMAYMKENGHEVDVIIENYDDTKYLSLLNDKLHTFNPDFVSITMLSTNRVMGYKCISVCTDVKVVVGGVHATVFPNQLIEKYPQIQVVVGEGEKALLDIVNGCTDRIVGREFIENLDDIPFPYIEPFMTPERTIIDMLTTRGCPFSCHFCCNPITKHIVRKRSVENVLTEIINIKAKYPHINEIHFQDDAFTLDNQRAIEIFKSLYKLNLNIRFIVTGRVKPISDELFFWMDKLGVWIYIGLESGNQSIIDTINKKITLEEVTTFFNTAKKYPRIIISTLIIAGLPGETWETTENTAKFINRLQKIKYDMIVDVYPIYAYPGTKIYEIMKENGSITDKYWLSDMDCVNYTCENNQVTLAKMRKELLTKTSFLRIFTPKGFLHQATNAPLQLLEFVIYHPRLIKPALGESFAATFPNIYRKLHGNTIESRWEI